MDEYMQAFPSGAATLPGSCDLKGVYGRITRGADPSAFVHLSTDPAKRLSWVVDGETLRDYLGKSHLQLLISCGHSLEWIRHQLNNGKQFKLILFSCPTAESGNDAAKLATWENIFELLAQVYPEIEPRIWKTYAADLKRLKYEEIDPSGTILKNYYLGHDSEHYMTNERFKALKEPPTLNEVRAFLHHHIGLNELFQGDGRTTQHDGTRAHPEYLVRNRRLDQFPRYVLLDLHPILPDLFV